MKFEFFVLSKGKKKLEGVFEYLEEEDILEYTFVNKEKPVSKEEFIRIY